MLESNRKQTKKFHLQMTQIIQAHRVETAKLEKKLKEASRYNEKLSDKIG